MDGFKIDLLVNPEALLLLLFIPLFIFWYRRYYRQNRLILRLSYDPQQIAPVSTRLIWLRYVPWILQFLAFASLVLALARPQTAEDIVARRTEGTDIMLLLDTSGSMETEDFDPNRLEVAKEKAIAFVRGRKDDRIGVVLFAEQALSYAPLTLDYDLLEEMISEIRPGMIPKEGTALGTAIASGINRMRSSENPSKVMILLTDGANNRGRLDPITAARLAKQFQLRIYCIGVGSPELKNQPGQEYKAELDEETLKNISKITGGSYFLSTDSGSLQQIFSQISRMETLEYEDLVYRNVEDRYPFWIQLALVCLAGAYLFMLTPYYNPLEQ